MFARRVGIFIFILDRSQITKPTKRKWPTRTHADNNKNFNYESTYRDHNTRNISRKNMENPVLPRSLENMEWFESFK